MKKLLLGLLLGVPMAEAGEQWIKDAAEGAPPHITDKASYLKWEGGRFVEKVVGSNGFVCLTLEDKQGRFEPSCLNQVAVTSILPLYQIQTRMLEQGKSINHVHSEIERLSKAGQLVSPGPGAMVYMMSPRNKYFDHFSQKLLDIEPHIMLYIPKVDNKSLGLNGKSGLPSYYEEYPHLGVIHIHTTVHRHE